MLLGSCCSPKWILNGQGMPGLRCTVYMHYAGPSVALSASPSVCLWRSGFVSPQHLLPPPAASPAPLLRPRVAAAAPFLVLLLSLVRILDSIKGFARIPRDSGLLHTCSRIDFRVQAERQQEQRSAKLLTRADVYMISRKFGRMFALSMISSAVFAIGVLLCWSSSSPSLVHSSSRLTRVKQLLVFG